MVALGRDRRSLLPLRWPRRVRSATLQAISLAQFALTSARAVAANSLNARIRLKEENDRLRQEVALLLEELRIKDARMERIPAQRRPHYPPTERLAILELRAARAWSSAQTAERLLVTPATVASWMSRLDKEGPNALLRLPIPVNKFPEFVRYIVQRLKVLCPTMGKERVAKVLCRAGLHLGATTVRRMLREPRKPVPVSAQQATKRRVTAREPNHVWHVDLSTVPTSLGFWTAWSPFALPQRWPFCWWIAVVVDHYSRRVMGIVAFAGLPSSAKVQLFLDRVIQRAGLAPRHLITDHGGQFTAGTFGRWCRRRGIRQRFGAIGKYGSLAVVERFIRTVENECRGRILLPYRLADFQRAMTLFISWYNAERPHGLLETRTPDEVYFALRPACRAPRFEPRPRWPPRSPCAGPNTLIRGRPGVQPELDVRFQRGRRHLPIVEIRRAA